VYTRYVDPSTSTFSLYDHPLHQDEDEDEDEEGNDYDETPRPCCRRRRSSRGGKDSRQVPSDWWDHRLRVEGGGRQGSVSRSFESKLASLSKVLTTMHL
jgi:hypothetical protein